MKQYIFYFLTRIIVACIRILPRPIAARLLRNAASIAYYLDSHHRHIADVNLKIAFPALSSEQRMSIARKSFQNTAMNLLEISRFSLLNRSNIPSLVVYDSANGLNNLEAALSKGKGILYLTGHFSAWELLPAAHALYGYPLSFVTRPLDNEAMERYFKRIRETTGNRVLHKKNATRPILKCLKGKGAAGILMDQNTSLNEGIFADFFGLPAATTTGLTLLALRTGAPIVPGYLTPMHCGRYTIKFLPHIEVVRTGDRNRDIQVNTEILNRVMESIIREQPESWLWGHKRWKLQPAENPQDLYDLPEDVLDEFLGTLQGGDFNRKKK